MKALIIYHANCDDGFGAAWVAHEALSITTNIETNKPYYDSVSLHEGIYNQPPPYEKIDQETEVFIVDFSYPAELLTTLAGKAKHTTVLDHHKTAQADLEFLVNTKDYLTIIFDMERSGAMITWDYFYTDSVYKPILIRHIQDNDLWLFKEPYTKEFILALRSYPQTLEQWESISNEVDNMHGWDKFIEEGRTIQRYYFQKLGEVKKNSSPFRIQGVSGIVYDGLVCNAPVMFCSDLANQLAIESVDGVGATWFENDKKEVIFSLRSDGRIDVSAIAKCYGGGGHKNAAGFKLKVPQFSEDGVTTIWWDTKDA